MSKFVKVAALSMCLLIFSLASYELNRFCKPQSIQGGLRASFAGMTNNEGQILVLLTNSSRWKITYHPRIEIKESGSWPAFPANIALDDIAKPRTIEPFTNQPVALIPPSNASEWRLWILYVAATERNQKVQKAQSLLENIGLSSVGYRIELDKVGLLRLPESKASLNRGSD